MLRSVLFAVVRDLYEESSHRADLLESIYIPTLRLDDPD